MFSIEFAIQGLTVLATAVMAASASIQAVRSDFDAIGAIFLSLATAVGGGTLRDLLIGAAPVFWLKDPIYLSTAVPVALITFLAGRRMQAGSGRRQRLLNYLDAIGLALFTLVGIKVSLANGISPEASVVMGCVTGIAGGMVRDVLCGMTPLVLKKDIYATLSLGGGALYLGLRTLLADEISLGLAFAAIAVARIIVIARSPLDPIAVASDREGGS